MELVRKICELGHSQRKSLNFAVKQALRSVTIANADNLRNEKELLDLIKDELNVEEVVFTNSSNLSVTLDSTLDQHLIAKGEARQIMRAIQEARKEVSCLLDEVVEIELPKWPSELEEEIKKQTLVSKITKGEKLKIIRNG